VGNAIESKTSVLRESAYPGRGIVIGQTPNGKAMIQVYWIMGRSPSSRNRVFVEENGSVKTDTVDKSVPVDPLTMYYPAKSVGNCHIVTNGDQTDTICESIQSGGSFEAALNARTFEPDAPNYTPRISGAVNLDDAAHAYQLCALKTVAGNPDWCTRQYFAYETAIPGFGHCITTYSDDGDPLPSFEGEPIVVELFDDLGETCRFYWEVLNDDNKVSLLVKFIDLATNETSLEIANKYGEEDGGTTDKHR
jgi:hypothetical protein